MRPFLLLVPLFITAFAAVARAEESRGASALAVAALVAPHSGQALSLEQQSLLASYLDGRADAPRRVRQIRVRADRIVCRASNVDITHHVCDLSFGAKTVTLEGRQAHELFATLLEMGVAPEGAAGSMFAAVVSLDCLIDADAVAERAGAGAECHYRVE